MFYLRGTSLDTYARIDGKTKHQTIYQISCSFNVEQGNIVQGYGFIAALQIKSSNEMKATIKLEKGIAVAGYGRKRNGFHPHMTVGVNGSSGSIDEFLPDGTQAKASVAGRGGFFDLVLTYRRAGNTYNALMIPFVGDIPFLGRDFLGKIYQTTKEDISDYDEYKLALMRIYAGYR